MDSSRGRSSTRRKQRRNLSPRRVSDQVADVHHPTPLVHIAPGITGLPICPHAPDPELKKQVPPTPRKPVPPVIDGRWTDTGEEAEAACRRLRRAGYSWWYRDRLTGVIDLQEGFDILDNCSPFLFVRLVEHLSGDSCNDMPSAAIGGGDAAALRIAVEKLRVFATECEILPEYLPTPDDWVENKLDSVFSLMRGLIRRFCFYGGDADDSEYDPCEELLRWAQRRLIGHGAQVFDFAESWQDGRAFCALMREYLPEEIEYKCGEDIDVEYNWKLALHVLSATFGVVPFLSVNDCYKADEHTMMILVSIAYDCITGTRPVTHTGLTEHPVSASVNPEDDADADPVQDPNTLVVGEGDLVESSVVLGSTASHDVLSVPNTDSEDNQELPLVDIEEETLDVGHRDPDFERESNVPIGGGVSADSAVMSVEARAEEIARHVDAGAAGGAIDGAFESTGSPSVANIENEDLREATRVRVDEDNVDVDQREADPVHEFDALIGPLAPVDGAIMDVESREEDVSQVADQSTAAGPTNSALESTGVIDRPVSRGVPQVDEVDVKVQPDLHEIEEDPLVERVDFVAERASSGTSTGMVTHYETEVLGGPTSAQIQRPETHGVTSGHRDTWSISMPADGDVGSRGDAQALSDDEDDDANDSQGYKNFNDELDAEDKSVFSEFMTGIGKSLSMFNPFQ